MKKVLKKKQDGGMAFPASKRTKDTKSSTNKRGTTTTVTTPKKGVAGGTSSVTKKKKSGASTTFSKAARPTMGSKKITVSKSGKTKVKGVSAAKVNRKIKRASKKM